MEVLTGPNGIRIEMDAKQIFPDDPGQGTPVLVCFANGDTGTWNCVTSEGETADGTQLDDEQKEWIGDMETEVAEWMEEHGV